jgi:hypothetical protein
VSGRGTARAKPEDTCIQIWEAGPNRVPDSPLGSIDDTLLGTGGTDASGNFVAADGSFGIPIATPLRAGQRIFAVDVCADLLSTVFLIVLTPAPVLSPLWLLTVALGLAAAGIRRLARRAG